MTIRNTRRAAVTLMLAAAFAIGSPVAASASSTSDNSVQAPWTVLRDNFISYESCESYRTLYAVNYPYVEGSYCTDDAQGNGRHWLWVFYAT